MGALQGIRGQNYRDRLFDASGTINTGGTAQLILPAAFVRSSLILENISAVNMLFEFGGPRATATLSSGVVSACTVTNAGFGYTIAPEITFLGGQTLQQTGPAYTLPGSADYPSPSHIAKAHCVMTGTAPNLSVAFIVIDDPGANYAYPPLVLLTNHRLDPYGCALPSATSGVLLLANGGNYTANGSVCNTDQIAVYCATTGSAYTTKYTL